MPGMRQLGYIGSLDIDLGNVGFKRTACCCRDWGWPNLLLRGKLPTGNKQGSAGMATVGSGAYTYEPVENWAKLPPGWSFKEIGGVGVDRHDNVFVFNRGEHPMIVFDCDGNFLRSFGEGMFPRAHGVFMAPDDTIWLTDVATTPSASARWKEKCC